MRGHVRKRGNKWCFVLDLPTEDGKRHQKWFSGYRTQKDAERAMNSTMAEIQKGTFVEPSRESLTDYLNTWLNMKKPNIKRTTYELYEILVREHIVPYIGKLEMGKVNAVHLTQLYQKLHDKGHLSPTTINKVHNLIKNAFNTAIRYNFVSYNPALAVDAPKPSKKQMMFWSEEESAKFLDAARDDRLYVAFHLAIFTGMRRGEILGLRWRDIDIDAQTITINQTLSPRGDSFQDTKTVSGRRTIAISKQTISELKKQYTRIRQERLKAGPLYENNDLIVCTSLGTKVIPRNLLRSFNRLMDQAKITRIRFHDLRHTHATIMLKQGVHPKIVSERLGHANIRITLDTYSHVLPGLQEAAAAKFEEAFSTPKNNTSDFEG